jgi:hypothetical protein
MEADEYYIYLELALPPSTDDDKKIKGMRGREHNPDKFEGLPRPRTSREKTGGLFKEVKKKMLG